MPEYFSMSDSTANSKRKAGKRVSKTLTLPGESPESVPILIITSLKGNFQTKKLELFEPIKIGRQTSAKTVPTESNGYFDNKVLSRIHAEVYAENGKVYIKDLKSSNGTFVNGERLSEEGIESSPKELKDGDSLDFGVDIIQDDGTVMFERVSTKISISNLGSLLSSEEPRVEKENEKIATVTSASANSTAMASSMSMKSENSTSASSSSSVTPQTPSKPPVINGDASSNNIANGGGTTEVSDFLQEEYKKSLQQGQDLNRIHDILSDIRVLLDKSPKDQQVQKLKSVESKAIPPANGNSDKSDEKEALRKKVAEFEKLITQNGRERDELKRKLDEITKEVDVLKTKVIPKYEGQIKVLEVQLEKFQKNDQDLSKVNEEKASLLTQNSNLSERCKKVTLDLEKAFSDIETLKKSRETDIKALEQSKINDINALLSRHAEDLKQLDAKQSEKVSKYESKVNSAEKRIQDLESQLDALNLSIEVMRKGAADQSNKLQSIGKENENLQSAIAVAKREKESAESKLSALEEKTIISDKKVKESLLVIDELSKKISGLDASLAKAKLDLEASSLKRTELENSLSIALKKSESSQPNTLNYATAVALSLGIGILGYFLAKIRS